MFYSPILKVQINTFKYTISTIIIGITLLSLSINHIINLRWVTNDLYLNIHVQLLSKILFTIFIIACGLIIDLLNIINNKKKHNHKSEHLKVMQATMSTVQDIVNNSFNSLQIIRIKAESGEEITQDDINTFDYIIQNTSNKINSLKNYRDIKFVKLTSQHIGVEVED